MNSKVVIAAREEADTVRKAAAAEVKSILAYADLNAEQRASLDQAVTGLSTDIKVAIDAARFKAYEGSVGRLKDIANEFGIDAMRGAIRRMTSPVVEGINLRVLADEAAEEIRTASKIESLVEEMKSLGSDAVTGLFRKMSDAGVIANLQVLAGGAAEDNLEYAIVLTECGPNKINVIKCIREITNFGLKEAKDLADAASYSRQTIKSGMTLAEAKRCEAKFADAGASSVIAEIASVAAVGR
jgi:large subunit ribosomal protein L7/L12